MSVVERVEQLRRRPVRTRVAGLDRLRGLAILCMLVDHLVLVTQGPGGLRWTVGRLALPAFFVLAGHLARTPNARHALIAWVGLVLPWLVPWIDHPNVLVLYALGVVVLWLFHQLGRPWWLVVLALTWGVNGLVHVGHSYDALMLFGFMALGACMPRSAFEWTDRLPAGLLSAVGRRPLSWYVGHLLVLEALVRAGVLPGGH